jgi:tRNA(Ile)-lysidine synthase
MEKEIYKCEFAKDKTVIGAIKTIESFNMIDKGDKILISVSGGPDSVFLTHLLYLMMPIYGLKLYGFCLDHMTRDGESTRDSLFVKELYRKLGIKLFSRKIDAKKWCRSNNLSFQEGARKLRLEKLFEISEKKDIDKIAVGHNADDNIETFIMRLMRGAGARGLSSIKPVSGKIIRPLINTVRNDIISYLERNNISYCVDRTNLENIYFRNRIRNIIIPFMEKECRAKSFRSNLTRSIDIIREESEFIEEYSLGKLLKAASVKKDRSGENVIFIKVPVSGINKESVAVRRRMVLSALEMTGSNLEDISFKNVDDILRICTSGGEYKAIYPESKLRVFKAGSYIYFVNVEIKGSLPEEIKSFLKDIKGEDKKSKGKEVRIGIRIRLDDFNLELWSELLRSDIEKINLKGAKITEAFLDYDKVKPPLRVRTWGRGDKFYPLGMNSEKKIQDFFIDSKIQVNLRKLVPIFTDREKIIWVGNNRIDNRVRVTEDTRKVLHLRLFKK